MRIRGGGGACSPESASAGCEPSFSVEVGGRMKDSGDAGSAGNPPRHIPTGTVGGTFINIFKNVLGSGMLAVPYMFSLCGWGQTLCVLAFVQGAAILNVYFIIQSVELARARRTDGVVPSSYQELAEEAFPERKERAGQAVELVVACYTSATLVAYGKLIVEMFQDPWGDSDSVLKNKYLIAGLAFCALVPLASLRTVEALRTTSVVGNLILAYTVVLVVFSAVTGGDEASSEGASEGNGRAFKPFIVGVGLFQAVPTLLFGYNFHYNVPMYYKELQHRSVPKMLRLVLCDYACISIFYMLIGFAGYYAFGDDTRSNITKNLDQSLASTKACQLLLGVMIILTFPVIQFATRGALGRLFKLAPPPPPSPPASPQEGAGCTSCSAADDDHGVSLARLPVDAADSLVVREVATEASPLVSPDAGASPAASAEVAAAPTASVAQVHLKPQHRIGIAVACVAFAFGLSMLVPNIGVVLAFNGSLFGVGQQFLAPTLFFYRLSKNTDTPKYMRSLALTVHFIGYVVTVLGVYGTIVNIQRGNSR
eukprot:Rhum_TRINITY_DN23150_c0_g1::Rhum_TRINITY_DN23150_c0_g1_i1::g.177260::m.177260